MFKNFIKIISCVTVLWSYEAMASQEYLHVWKSLDDVAQFSDYVAEQGIDKLDEESFKVVANTVSTLKGQNDPLLLCILTKAQYSVADAVEALSGDISSNLSSLINATEISFKTTDLNTPIYYTIKWVWLLFLSQTENCKGERMADGFSLYPISIAEELLDKQANGLVTLASSIKREIKRVREL